VAPLGGGDDFLISLLGIAAPKTKMDPDREPPALDGEEVIACLLFVVRWAYAASGGSGVGPA